MNAVRGARCAITFAAVLTLVSVSGLFAQSADVIGIPVGGAPPAVVVEDLQGNPVDLGQWIGKKPVLIEFWASWCPQCAELLPAMEAAQRRFGPKIEFLVIAVAVNQTPRSVARHLERHPMPFTFLWDAKGAAVRAFQAPATSYVVVLGTDGKVAYTGVGGTQELDGALELVTR